MVIAFLRRIVANRKGATAVEYGLILALIVIAMIASFLSVANATIGMWGNVQSKVAAVTPT